MKLKDIKWPKRLANAKAIVKFAQQISPIDEDEDELLEMFDGRSATLKDVEVSWLKRQEDVELRDEADVNEYAGLSAETQPPLLVENDGTIMDGAHRFEAAKKRGDKTLLAYVFD
jgi:hypothetical protein